MKIHLAFDMTDIDAALAIAHQTISEVDIFEVGSLLILQHGISAVTRFKQALGRKEVLADIKIADRAEQAVKLCAQAGADWITVLSGTRSAVIHTACQTAHQYGKHIMLDLIDASSLGQSALEAKELGVDALLLHVIIDPNDPTALQDTWDMVAGNTDLPIYLTGSFTLAQVPILTALKPAALVLGKQIILAQHPAQTLRTLGLHAPERL
jgi:3-hexulose-6-phosphate synthase